MVASMNDECIRFIKDYYRTLTRTPRLLHKFYLPSAQISVSLEGEEAEIHTENHSSVVLDKHKKRIEKVLISAFDCQTVRDLLFVAVIGEFVYSNNVVIRYSQQFVIERGEKYHITNENCRLLDEEVIFETKKPKKDSLFYESKIGHKVNFDKGTVIKVTGGEVNRAKIFDVFHSIGKIWAIESRENKYFVEFSRSEDLQKIKSDEILKNYGFEVNTVGPMIKNY